MVDIFAPEVGPAVLDRPYAAFFVCKRLRLTDTAILTAGKTDKIHHRRTMTSAKNQKK